MSRIVYNSKLRLKIFKDKKECSEEIVGRCQYENSHGSVNKWVFYCQHFGL